MVAVIKCTEQTLGSIQMIAIALLAMLQATSTPAGSVATPSVQSGTSPIANATPAVGAIVYDPTGAPAATVESVSGDAVVLSTGTNKLSVPRASIGTGAKGMALSVTRAELDAAAEKAKVGSAVELKSALVAGATVRTMSGTNVVGQVKEADDQTVTLTTDKGEVRVPLSAFSMGANGIIVGLTGAQFDAAVAAAKKPS